MNNKKKQIILSIIAITLIVIGYCNYNLDNNEDNIKISEVENEANLGDVELVNSFPENKEPQIVPNDEEIKKENVSNYFEETRLERERMYSQMLEAYQKVIDNYDVPSEQKAIMVQKISDITNQRNGIMIAENLIKNKGFENVVILINNDRADVVVKGQNFSKEQISQIQNIVEREIKIKISNINISSNFY